MKVKKCKKRVSGLDMLKKILRPTVNHLDLQVIRGVFKKPLIDHEQRYTISVNGIKTDLCVWYGYFNHTSAEQLSTVTQVFSDKSKQQHFHTAHTFSKELKRFDNRKGQHKMIKLMFSTKELDNDTWNKIAGFSFDDRYDTLQQLDTGNLVRPSNLN